MCICIRTSLVDNLSSTTCSSSTITHLNIKLHNIDDCFLLLDGRLSELQTLKVKLDFIHDQELLRRIPLKILCHSIILILFEITCFQKKTFLPTITLKIKYIWKLYENDVRDINVCL